MARHTLLGPAAALALAACSEPKGVEIDVRQLIPAEAEFVFGGEVAPVRASPLAALLLQAASADTALKTMLDVVPKCPVDLDHLRLTFAGMLTDDTRFLGVLEGPGIGDKDTVRCMEKEFARATGRAVPVLIPFTTRGDVSTLPQQGGGNVVILNRDALVTTSAPWDAAVFAAIEQPAARTRATTTAVTVQKIAPQTDAWFVVSLTDAHRAEMTMVAGFDAVTALSVTGDLADGLDLAVTADVTSPAKAAELKAAVDEMLANLKDQELPPGLPANLFDMLTVSSTDTSATLTFDIPASAVPSVLTSLLPLLTAE